MARERRAVHDTRAKRGHRVLWLVLLVTAITTTAARQEQSTGTASERDRSRVTQPATTGAGTPAQRSTFRAEANYIRVDVYPTLNGQPLRDLTIDDFEILEDGVPQKIETFQRVEIHGRVPEFVRREPNTVAEGRSMAEDPDARVFAIFLDTYHTDAVSAYRMRRPLVDMLDRLIGPDDLYAIMTPEMSARDISLARRTTTIDAALSDSWKNWGRRNSVTELDPEEQLYKQCYPGSEGEEPAALRALERPRSQSGLCQGAQSADFYAGVATQMIARRREKRSLDALSDLSVYLGGLRDDRKTVIVVSDGWVLFRPNTALMRIGPCDAPPPPGTLGVGPDGRLTTDMGGTEGYASRRTCERDRMYLAGLDNGSAFRDLLDTANRYNVSFYTIDPRGLSGLDADLNEDVTPVDDHSRMTARSTADSGQQTAGSRKQEAGSRNQTLESRQREAEHAEHGNTRRPPSSRRETPRYGSEPEWRPAAAGPQGRPHRRDGPAGMSDRRPLRRSFLRVRPVDPCAMARTPPAASIASPRARLRAPRRFLCHRNPRSA